MRKRLFTAAVLIASAMLFSGCFGGREVNQRAFVQLMGLEKTDGVYMVTLQIYRSESDSPEPDVSKANSAAVSASGVTISEALSKAEVSLGQELFLGHIKMLIIGGGIENPADELSLFMDGTVSPSCPVVYSDDPAAATETMLESGVFSAEQFLKLMDSAASNGKTVYTSAARLAADTGVLNCAAALPVVTARNDTVTFDGLTFARRNGTAGVLAEEDVPGVKLLLDQFESGDRIILPLTVDGKAVSAALTGSKTKLKASVTEGKLCITADIGTKISVAENPYGVNENKILQAARESIRESCISAFSTAAWYNSCDIFGIKKLILHDCPEFYEEYCTDPDRYLAESVLNIRVE